ncbi:hypothetical protein CcaCcLH18_07597 [Colletotrichum camelliae]|nr:hypothetical protein CcaCcLH18_07597 [Colletotrichum camelliae]
MRFTNIVTIFASATATSALPLLGLFSSAPTATSLLQNLGVVNNELIKLNASLAGLNVANLQSQATGTGSNVDGLLTNLLGPVLQGLTGNGGLQTAYATALSQLGTLNNQGLILSQAQAAQFASTVTQYQAVLTQALAQLQAIQPAITSTSSGGLLSSVQGLLGGILGTSSSTATPVSTVQNWLQTTLGNNNSLLGGLSTLLQRTQPTIQSTLQQINSILQGLIRAQVTVYGVYGA